MVEAILSIFGGIFSWLGAREIDSVVGKWVAYFVISFEKSSSEKAKKVFSETINELKIKSKENASAWEKWRERTNHTP